MSSSSGEAPPERRTIVVSADRHHDSPPTSVVVQVRDTGVGIGEADLSRLFDPFYTTKSGGLGMGLAVGKAIIERHSGRMWVSRNADHGVTFHFSIPTL